jgi:hypothetical protein
MAVRADPQQDDIEDRRGAGEVVDHRCLVITRRRQRFEKCVGIR